MNRTALRTGIAAVADRTGRHRAHRHARHGSRSLGSVRGGAGEQQRLDRLPHVRRRHKAIPATDVTLDPGSSFHGDVYATDAPAAAGTRPGQDFWIDKMLASDGRQPDEPGGLSFEIDRNVPILAATCTPSSGNGTPRNPIAVAFTGADTMSGLGRVQYRINSGAWQTAPESEVQFATVGDRMVTYRATDLAGNVSTVKSVSFSIGADPATTINSNSAKVKPATTITLPLAGFVRWDDVTVTIGGTAVGQVLTDRNGTARVTVRVPAAAADQATPIVATGPDGTTTAPTSSTVEK